MDSSELMNLLHSFYFKWPMVVSWDDKSLCPRETGNAHGLWALSF